MDGWVGSLGGFYVCMYGDLSGCAVDGRVFCFRFGEGNGWGVSESLGGFLERTRGDEDGVTYARACWAETTSRYFGRSLGILEKEVKH